MRSETSTVGIVPGTGLVARFGGVVVFLADANAATDRILGAVRAAADGERPGPAIAQRLAAVVFAGSAEPPPFGVVAPNPDGTLLLLRGPVSAQLHGAEGLRTLAGERAFTWVDEIVREPVRTISVGPDEAFPLAVAAHSDLREGVVPGGGFVLRAALRKAGGRKAATRRAPKSAAGEPPPTQASGFAATPEPTGAEVAVSAGPATAAEAAVPGTSATTVRSGRGRKATGGSTAGSRPATGHAAATGYSPADAAAATGHPGTASAHAAASDPAPTGYAAPATGHAAAGPAPATGHAAAATGYTPVDAAEPTGHNPAGTGHTPAGAPSPTGHNPAGAPASSTHSPAGIPLAGTPSATGHAAAATGHTPASPPSATGHAAATGHTPAGTGHNPTFPPNDADPTAKAPPRPDPPRPLAWSQVPDAPHTFAPRTGSAPPSARMFPPRAGESPGRDARGRVALRKATGSGTRVMPVVPEPESGALGALVLDGTAYPLDRPYVIGRGPQTDAAVKAAAAAPLVLPRDRHVSRVHAYVDIDNGNVFVRDAGTGAGTFVAAPGTDEWARIGTDRTELPPGARVRISDRVLTYLPDQPH
ncbi:FHA domain-containing protein [Nocardia sp. NPDC050697]|uniref:FHA domain-containing protein n=1 Tax=Nocardia sp. NPDC050697 TaxID=3155158 RepID=UPI0033EB4DFB